MDVVFTLSNMLFDNDKVIVPGLGEFTTEIEKGYIHPVEHSFKPEFKKIHFRYNEDAKDHLLINAFLEPNAALLLNDFVKSVLKELKEGKKVQFKNIGFIYTHHTGEVLLEQDLSFNHIKKNFGLESFIHEPINKVVASEAPIKAIVDEPQKKKSRIGYYIVFAAIVILTAIIFWKWDLVNSYIDGDAIAQSDIGEQSSGVKEPDNSETHIIADTSDKKGNLTIEDTTIVIDEPLDTNYNDQVESAVTSVASESQEIIVEDPMEKVVTTKEWDGPSYYVIAGCFKSETKAQRLLEKLLVSGYNDASIEGKTPTGLIRVCYASFEKRSKASSYMLKLQNEGRQGVWIQKSN